MVVESESVTPTTQPIEERIIHYKLSRNFVIEYIRMVNEWFWHYIYLFTHLNVIGWTFFQKRTGCHHNLAILTKIFIVLTTEN